MSAKNQSSIPSNMLKELDHNSNMADTRKQKLTIHHSNLFHPTPLGIIAMAASPDNNNLAVIRKHVSKEKVNVTFTIIEIYQLLPNFCAKPTQTIVEYENLIGIVWLNQKMIMSVSQEQTINLYKTKDGAKVFTTITDYGPILCTKYLPGQGILFTGTEYGYVAVYKVNTKQKSVDFLAKMVKVNHGIQSIDFVCIRKEAINIALPVSKPVKRKRKQIESSDEESDIETVEEQDFLSMHNITIYAASEGSVIAWDLQRKTIIDTINVAPANGCHVQSVLTLKNGDCIAGDSKGTISILDNKSLTCKQSINLLKSGISCLAMDTRQTNLFVSGEDPTIMILKRNDQGDFILFDSIHIHTNHVKSILVMKKGFISGAMDGRLVRFKKRSGQSLSRIITLSDNTDKIKFFRGEMMVQSEKSLIIWRLPSAMNPGSPKKAQSMSKEEPDQGKPMKLVLIKARTFIHASTFSDKWVSYSTKNDLHIFERSEQGLKSYRPDQKLPGCGVLELCLDNRYLAAASSKSLHVVDLTKPGNESLDDSDISEKKVGSRETRCIVQRLNLKSSIKQLMNFGSMDLLVVVCASPKNYIYAYKLQAKSETSLVRQAKFCLGQQGISFITYNASNKRDSCIYLYTTCDRLIKLDLKIPDTNLSLIADCQDRICGLPEDANVLGMIVVSKDHCLLYDDHRIFKVDMTNNKLVNMNSDFMHILRLDNLAFQKYDQVALAELTPDDYQSLLPKCKSIGKKFGSE